MLLADDLPVPVVGWAYPAAELLLARAEQLALMTEEPSRITRRAFTPTMREVQEQVAAWMHAAGMAVRRDNIGNLIGVYPAPTPNAPTLLIGSHLDTVRDAGKYDGPLGVLAGLACVEQLAARGQHLPFNLEVIAFVDEEGLRFHTAYLGSEALSGDFEPAYLHLTDDEGITLADAIRAFGGNPERIAQDRRDPATLLGYCELHIEQGPVLEASGVPVGVVTAIAGQTRMAISFRGEAGHAGTVPMQLRRDALCGAAEFVLAVEAYTRESPDMVATVGRINAYPDVSNVIPAEVTISLDVRHKDNSHRELVCKMLLERAQHICITRHLTLDWRIVHENLATPCDPTLSGILGAAVQQAGYPLLHLPSGAGHDAVAMARITPISLLFVRCAGGISHHPAEAVQVGDVAGALDVLHRFVHLLADQPSRATEA